MKQGFGVDVPPFSMPFNAASEMTLLAFDAASLTVSVTDFCERTEVEKRRALRATVARNMVTIWMSFKEECDCLLRGTAFDQIDRCIDVRGRRRMMMNGLRTKEGGLLRRSSSRCSRTQRF